MRSRCSRQIASAIAALGLTSSFTNLHAAVVTWTGADGNPNWSDGNNWNPASVPGPADEALFNNAGNSQTTVTVGTQTTGSIEFDSGAAAYTIGTSTDTLTLGGTSGVNLGGIYLNGNVGNSQAVNANINFTNAAPYVSNTYNGAVTLGSATSPGVIGLANSSTLFLYASNSFAGGAVINVNDSIQGSANVTIPSNTNGTVVMAGASTYTGTTAELTGSAVIQIGSSSNGTSGPFGKSTIVVNNNPNDQAIGGDQTIDNAWNVGTSGFTISDAASGGHNLTLTGPITYSATAGKTITLNNYGQTVTFGSSSTPSTLTLNNKGVNLAINPGNSATLGVATFVINDAIVDPTFKPTTPDTISFNSTGNNSPMGAVILNNGNSTYSGGTTFNGPTSSQTALIVQIGASSTGGPGAVTSGPFGVGGITTNASNAPPMFEAHGADRTIDNALTLTSGFFVAADPGGAHNLTFTAPFTDGKTITNNLPAGVALLFGSSPTTTNTLTITTATFQSQQTGTGATGETVLNDLVAGSGLVTLQGSASATAAAGIYYFDNAGNTYSGNMNVTGPTQATGHVGSGATLAGTGKIGTGNSLITISTSTHPGGNVSPGGSGPSNPSDIGTLTVASMAWNPVGQYVYQYSADNSSNDLISGTGSLSLAGLSSAAQFNLELQDQGAGNATTPYILATFANGINGASGALAAGTDVTADFSGLPSNAEVTVGNPDGSGSSTNLELTFVPEPASLSLLSLGAIGLGRRRRRQ